MNFALPVTLPWAVVTVILPFFVPFGTVTSSVVGETTVNAAARLPSSTWDVESSALPLTITVEPVKPLAGLKLETVGTFEATGPTGAESS